MRLFNKKPPLRPSPSSPPRQKLLLVDEDSKDLKYFTTLLERMGYSVRAFADYGEVIGCLEHGCFDLVIVSQGSSLRGAHRLVEFTIGRDRYTPVLVLTPRLDMNCYFEAMQFGATDYLEKPLTTAEFERVVTTHCQPRDGEIFSSTS